MHKPEWFQDGKVFVSFAETVGINKDGNELYGIDSATGKRTDVINNAVDRDIQALLSGQDLKDADTARWVDSGDVSVAVPVYFDDRQTDALADLLEENEFAGFTSRSIGDLEQNALIQSRPGHGSPSADRRTGNIPYIKVSDIRAGQVNINPSNRVPRVVAEEFWKGPKSGVGAFDIVSPIRTSKNIGEFAVVMPGQEESVFTKEMLFLRVLPGTGLDNFYLLWALSLRVVREQWRRVVFMQTNREDVGKRYKEIEIPWPNDPSEGLRMSSAFRDYYVGIQSLRETFRTELHKDDRYHVFLGDAAELADEFADEADSIEPSSRTPVMG